MDNIDRSKLEKYEKRTRRDRIINAMSFPFIFGLFGATIVASVLSVPIVSTVLAGSLLAVSLSSLIYENTVAPKNSDKLEKERANVRAQERELKQKPSLPTPSKSDTLTPPANHRKKLTESRNISADEQALSKER